MQHGADEAWEVEAGDHNTSVLHGRSVRFGGEGVDEVRGSATTGGPAGTIPSAGGTVGSTGKSAGGATSTANASVSTSSASIPATAVTTTPAATATTTTPAVRRGRRVTGGCRSNPRSAP